MDLQFWAFWTVRAVILLKHSTFEVIFLFSLFCLNKQEIIISVKCQFWPYLYFLWLKRLKVLLSNNSVEKKRTMRNPLLDYFVMPSCLNTGDCKTLPGTFPEYSVKKFLHTVIAKIEEGMCRQSFI